MKAIAYTAGMMAIAVTAAGCATTPPSPPPTPVVIQSDTYCRIARVIRWSPRDTRQTIADVRRHNARHAAACRGARS